MSTAVPQGGESTTKGAGIRGIQIHGVQKDALRGACGSEKKFEEKHQSQRKKKRRGGRRERGRDWATPKQGECDGASENYIQGSGTGQEEV